VFGGVQGWKSLRVQEPDDLVGGGVGLCRRLIYTSVQYLCQVTNFLIFWDELPGCWQLRSDLRGGTDGHGWGSEFGFGVWPGCVSTSAAQVFGVSCCGVPVARGAALWAERERGQAPSGRGA
jgi:hypothetical protein